MKDLSRKAKILIILTILAGAMLSVHYLTNLGRLDLGLVIIAGLAALTQIFKVEGTTDKSSYNLSWLLYGFAFMQLGAPATLFVILTAHLVEWVWHKYPWYVQLYNIATYAIAVTTATLVSNAINPAQTPLTLLSISGLLAGMVIFTLSNHLLVGLVIWFARGQNFIQSGVFGFLTLMIDFTIMALGIATAIIWAINPFAAIFVLAPIFLIQNGLKIPSLKRQTEIDLKTGLYNAKYFATSFEKELERAKRFNRPLTVVLGDLDLLRNINNTYGHLAGDVVLVGIAAILQKSFRDYDLVARFGGEEFAIMMAETNPEDAIPLVEAVRQAIEATDFEVDTSVQPIKATISFGLSGINGTPGTPTSTNDVINDADSALYYAKLSGRNNTCVYSNEELEELFNINNQGNNTHKRTPIEARFESSQYPFRPNPLREQPKETLPSPEKHQPSTNKLKQPWQVNAYIGSITLVAIGLGILGISPYTPPDFFGILVFSLVILLSEVLSIEIYTKDSSVSTAAAPLIAGALLFGPLGALILSIVIATTAAIKKRSNFVRIIFNTSNHFISSSLCASLIFVTKDAFTSYPAVLQLMFALGSGIIVYFSSTLLLTGVLHLSKNQPFLPLWKEHFSWLLPYYIAFGVVSFSLILGYTSAGIIGLVATLVLLLILRLSQVQYIENTKSMVSQLHRTNSELESNNKTISQLNEDILLSLANTIDLRDPYTMGHSKKVAHIAALIAQRLGLPAARIDMIRKSGLLHDIGKIGIPDLILFKPDQLTYEEFEAIKEHPVRGAEIVEVNHTLREIAPIIRHHHERYDGGGYPDALRGEEIPLEARILCLADSVQAMFSSRLYRKGLPLQDIKTEINENSGTQFDPKIAGVLLNILREDRASLSVPLSEYHGIRELERIDAILFSGNG